MFKNISQLTVLVAIGIAALPATSHAMHLDSRFAHNQYYHDHGEVVSVIPRGAYTVRHGGGVYLYHGGEWYRRNGRVAVVIAAPIGAFVPALPAFYSTVWWGGVPYYYADDNSDAGGREPEYAAPRSRQ